MSRSVWIVSREYDDIAGAGGLKDAVQGLALAMVREGLEVTVVLPRYGFVKEGSPLYTVGVYAAGQERELLVSQIYHESVRILLLDNQAFSEKKGIYTYTKHDLPCGETPGKGHRDVHLLNTLLQAGAVACCMKEGRPPDVIHGNDGHCGLLPLFVEAIPGGHEFFRHTGILLTVHNAGRDYQQEFANLDEAVYFTGLSEQWLEYGLVEPQINPILISGRLANLNTVSPGYSKELLLGIDPASSPLDSYFRLGQITMPGIVNGLDPKPWLPINGCNNPIDRICKQSRRSQLAGELDGLPRGNLSEPRIESLNGSPTESKSSSANEKLGESKYPGIVIYGELPDVKIPWILFHARLTLQKGVDAVLALPDTPPKHSCHLLVYGQGDKMLEALLIEKASKSSWFSYISGYHRTLTRRLFAAASFTIIPSLWEPCGQTDMVGQLLGALPIVRRTGGLTKVRHLRTGFSYSPDDVNGLERLIALAVSLEWKHPRRLSRMRRRAEKEVYEKRSWRQVFIRGYLPLYRKVRFNRHRRDRLTRQTAPVAPPTQIAGA